MTKENMYGLLDCIAVMYSETGNVELVEKLFTIYDIKLEDLAQFEDEYCHQKLWDLLSNYLSQKLDYENAIFIADWALQTKEDSFNKMCKDFGVELTNEKILVAFYCCEDWTGEAFVVFEKDGHLYTVSGSHCSCYGLEGQWTPELSNKEVIKHMFDKGRFSSNKEYNKQIKKALIDVGLL